MASLIGDSKEWLHKVTSSGTWLHSASAYGRINVAKRLIAMGADIDAKEKFAGASPIDRAASAGQLEMVKYLVSAGAKFDTSEPERNPLFAAIYGGHLEVVKFLIGAGIDPFVSYSGKVVKNMDALAFARERGQKEIANYLASLQR